MAHAKILKEGKTNINSTDVSDFAFHSDYKTLKIHNSGSVTVTWPACTDAGVSSTIYHGLGYVPNFFVYIEHAGKLYEIYGGSFCGDVELAFSDCSHYDTGKVYAFASINSNNLYVDIVFAGGGFYMFNDEDFTIHYSIQLDEE